MELELYISELPTTVVKLKQWQGVASGGGGIEREREPKVEPQGSWKKVKGETEEGTERSSCDKCRVVNCTESCPFPSHFLEMNFTW